MLVKTVHEHANRYGKDRLKKVGDEYKHPDPQTLITTGFVVDAAKAAEAEAKKAPKDKPVA